jgi:hypothetical protein
MGTLEGANSIETRLTDWKARKTDYRGVTKAAVRREQGEK